MAQRLKTDWILFFTIVAMVVLRPGDRVQRVVRHGRAEVQVGHVLHSRQVGWARSRSSC